MKRVYIHMIAFIAVLIALSSCNVYEDRMDCPSWLNLILDRCGSVKDVHVSAWNGTVLFSENISLSDYPHVYEREVEKGMTTICVFCGLDRSVRDGYDVVIPKGEQADSLFIHNRTLMCEDEFTIDTVQLKKHWTTVKMKVHVKDAELNIKSGVEDDYKFVVRSDISGVNMLSLEPLSGEFEFSPLMDDQGFFVFRLPRQEGDAEELLMDIYKDEVLIDELPLGRQLSSVNYDWTEDNLSDVDMTLHIATSRAVITVKPWEDLGKDHIIF